MRTVVVLECRTRGNARYWAWGLLNPNPPGFERLWYTTPGGGDPIAGFNDANVTFDGEVFTYTTRESMVTAGGGNSE